MVAAFDYCLHGKGGAAPSIDTAMHGLVDAAARRPPAPRLRDRDRDRRRRRGADRASASATGSSGCRGGAPASSSAWTSPRSRRRTRRPIGVHPRRPRHHRVGRHRPRRPRRTRWRSSHRRRRTSPSTAAPSRSARSLAGYEPLPEAERRAQGGGARPDDPRASPRTDRPQVGHFTDADAVLDFLARGEAPARWPSSAPRCPDHFLRTKVKPLVARPARRPRRVEEIDRPAAASCTRRTAPTTRPTTTATPPPDSPRDPRRRPG